MNWSKGKGSGGRASSFGRSMAYVTSPAERVGASDTLNLGGDLPNCATEMQTTVDAAIMLQRRQRVTEGKRERSSGSRIEKPVYAISLSWHPSESPSPEHMLATARAAIAALGLKDHQAVIVEHTDRPHRHVHILVNLVHPDTGRMANLYNDGRKLDRWAHEYEVSQDMLFSFKRAAHHKAIEKQAVPMTATKKAEVIKKLYEERKGQITAKQAEAAERRDQEYSALSVEHEAERQAVYDKYQPVLDEIWRHRPRTPEFNLRPDGSFAHKPKEEWKAIAKAMPEKQVRRPVRREFSAAQYRIKPSKDGPLARAFREVREGVDPMLPMKSTPEFRRWVQARTPKRTQMAAEVKKARQQEVKALDAKFIERRVALKSAHDLEKVAEARERAALRQQAVKVWSNFREEFNIKPRIMTPHVQKLHDRDKALLKQKAPAPPSRELIEAFEHGSMAPETVRALDWDKTAVQAYEADCISSGRKPDEQERSSWVESWRKVRAEYHAPDLAEAWAGIDRER